MQDKTSAPFAKKYTDMKVKLFHIALRAAKNT